MTTPVYTPQTWVNGRGGGTPLNSPRLSHMESGIAAAAADALLPSALKTSAASPYAANPNDFVAWDTSGGACVMNLPTAPAQGSVIAAKIVVAGNTLTINRGGTDVFNKTAGSTSLVLYKLFQTVWLQYYSGIWYVTQDGFPPDHLGVQATVSANGTGVEAFHNPFDATGGARTATLPTPSGPGRVISFEKVDASANAVNVTGSIDGVGSSTHVITSQNETMVFISSTGSWWRLAGYRSKAALDSQYLGGTRVTSTGLTAAVTTASLTVTDMTGATVTFTAVAGATYELKARLYVSNNTAGDGVVVYLTDNANAVLDQSPTIVSRTANDQFLVLLQSDVTPAAGSVTYKLRFNAVTGGTASAQAAANQRILITVTRVS